MFYGVLELPWGGSRLNISKGIEDAMCYNCVVLAWVKPTDLMLENRVGRAPSLGVESPKREIRVGHGSSLPPKEILG